MPGLNMQMGLGSSGSYSGPVFGADGPAAVPATTGYGDTSAPALMSFGPSGGISAADRSGAHGLAFGVLCFGLLIFMAWALPR